MVRRGCNTIAAMKKTRCCKRLIGIQTPRDIRDGDYDCVNKTSLIVWLVGQGSLHLLARPRRVGKPPVIDTVPKALTGYRAPPRCGEAAVAQEADLEWLFELKVVENDQRAGETLWQSQAKDHAAKHCSTPGVECVNGVDMETICMRGQIIG